MYKSRNYQLSKVFNKRPYKSRRQRPCDLCRKKKTCCIMRNTDVCLNCAKAGHDRCTFVDGPVKRTVKQISNPPILPSQRVPRVLSQTFVSYNITAVKNGVVDNGIYDIASVPESYFSVKSTNEPEGKSSSTDESNLQPPTNISMSYSVARTDSYTSDNSTTTENTVSKSSPWGQQSVGNTPGTGELVSTVQTDCSFAPGKTDSTPDSIGSTGSIGSTTSIISGGSVLSTGSSNSEFNYSVKVIPRSAYALEMDLPSPFSGSGDSSSLASSSGAPSMLSPASDLPYKVHQGQEQLPVTAPGDSGEKIISDFDSTKGNLEDLGDLDFDMLLSY